jgi:hypothetical protein
MWGQFMKNKLEGFSHEGMLNGKVITVSDTCLPALLAGKKLF